MILDRNLLKKASDGTVADSEALSFAECNDLPALMAIAAQLRDAGHHRNVSYSRKVFIPLTRLCRDSCHYCTFTHPLRRDQRAYLNAEQILEIAHAGEKAGCKEALFTLGDKPELRYQAVRDELAKLGHESTLSYLAAMAKLVLRETKLLPHLNPGVMSATEIARLREASVSQGLMLESTAERLSQHGQPHFGSPDKLPSVRLATIEAAGKMSVPFTSGILIGIGETRRERIEAMLALRVLSERYGHLQEVIIQNFRAKSATKMAGHAEPSFEDHLWTIAVARVIFGPAMSIQAPPNLADGRLERLIEAGINDWGGVSPVTPDHVNPERSWPTLDSLAQDTTRAGKILVERLAAYPTYVKKAERWISSSLRPRVLRVSDAEGLARTDSWAPGGPVSPPPMTSIARGPSTLGSIIDRAVAGRTLSESDLTALFSARSEDFNVVCGAADALRSEVCGDRVSYVVTRNINYTNVCTYRCRFCAFSKGKTHDHLRGQAYDLELDEIGRRAHEAWQRGAVEVCLQGGIHPRYTGDTYLSICRAIKSVVPNIHVHAFSPLEIFQGSLTLKVPVAECLERLKSAGLGSLPGTAAEILDDDVRAIICPDKIATRQWLDVITTAHRMGLRTTATIMFGHVDGPRHWARHLIHIRRVQGETGGFTEFVPLPFVPMEAPIQLRGQSRFGPTYREAILMHAVARLALHPLMPNIQTSWVKMGPQGAAACLQAGANDLGGTLMNESITRAAGAIHGQEMPPERMDALIRSIGRQPWQRTTLYRPASSERVAASFGAHPLTPVLNAPVIPARPTLSSEIAVN